jgi:hypothetical protein
MSTSRTQSFLTDIIDGDKPIPVGTIEYFKARLQSRLHQLVLAEFLRQEDKGLHQAELARRIGRKPEVINRLLGAPGNWTLNTVSDLLLGMCAELEIKITHLEDYRKPDAAQIDELNPVTILTSQNTNSGPSLMDFLTPRKEPEQAGAEPSLQKLSQARQ